jgi:RNA-directed DNA polymerase
MFKCLLSEVQYEVTVPTVSDRIAQMVAKRYIEPILEPVFHGDSYGCRPGRGCLIFCV